MHLELMRETAKEFPVIDRPSAITSARIWHGKYRSLGGVSRLVNLETLVIATYPDTTFEPLVALQRLRHLRVLHFPRVSDLAPIGELRHLESLSLASLPSWDSSGRVIAVASLEPIAKLGALRHLELFGVRPPDRRLTPLLALPSLRSARFSKFPKVEVRAFYEAKQVTDAFAPTPNFDAG